MQISLKQAEIVTALKQYVTNMGVNLSGKSITVDFTAGRKETGLTADINIDEGEPLPLLACDPEEAPAAPVLTIVPTPACEPEEKATKDEEPVPAPVAPAPTVSLFS